MGRQFVLQIDKGNDLDEIWVVARRRERLLELTELCRAKIRPIALDLADTVASVNSLRETLAGEKPDVKILVNASGFGKYGTYKDLTDKEICEMIDVNDKAMVLVTYAALEYMQRGARIITLGSGSSFQPLPEFNMYASTKAFVLHFCRALNVELKGRGISVTCVCPGYVNTEFFRVAQDTANPETCKNFTPLYEPEDVVAKALKDSKKGKDLSVLGFTPNFNRICGKLLPAKWVMATWMKIK